jgi:hypothetical protein
MAITCNGCGVDLTPENESDAHIIPNALGGRLAPRGLICRDCNTLLDRLADNPLIVSFGSWPTLIDVPRDRGKNPPVEINTADGQRIRLEADGTRSLIEVIYDVAPVEGGHKVTLGANNWKVVRQLIKKAVKEFPQLDRAAAEAHAQRSQIPPSAPWIIQTNFAPSNVFPGAFAAFWLFFLHKTGHTLAPWVRALEVMENLRSGGTFRYLPNGLPGLQGPDIPISHRIVLRSVSATGQLIGYLEILGALRIGGLLATGGSRTKAIEFIYVADVFAKTDRSSEFSIDSAAFESVDWNTIGLGYIDADMEALREHIRQSQAPLQRVWEEREAEHSNK